MDHKKKTFFLHPRLYSLIVFVLIALGVIAFSLLKTPIDHTPEVTLDENAPCFQVSFLDVGEADCILIRTPSGKSVMIDTGYSNRQPDVLNYIESQGVFSLDLMILTHPHEDHVQLAYEIFDYMKVGRLMIPNSPTYPACMLPILEKAEEKEIPIRVCQRGAGFTLDGAEFLVLCDGSEAKTNENASVILWVRYQEKTFLFTGDAPRAQEEWLLSTPLSLDCDVLKVAHHGSDTSSCEEFLQAVSPEIAVISVGKENPFFHPSFEVIQRLERVSQHVFRTDRNKTVTVITDGKKLKVFSQN